MNKFNEAALDAAVNGAAMKVAVEAVEIEVDKQSPVYDIPKQWKKLIKKHRHATFSAYARAAIEEKMQRDGLI